MKRKRESYDDEEENEEKRVKFQHDVPLTPMRMIEAEEAPCVNSNNLTTKSPEKNEKESALKPPELRYEPPVVIPIKIPAPIVSMSPLDVNRFPHGLENRNRTSNTPPQPIVLQPNQSVQNIQPNLSFNNRSQKINFQNTPQSSQIRFNNNRSQQSFQNTPQQQPLVQQKKVGLFSVPIQILQISEDLKNFINNCFVVENGLKGEKVLQFENLMLSNGIITVYDFFSKITNIIDLFQKNPNFQTTVIFCIKEKMKKMMDTFCFNLCENLVKDQQNEKILTREMRSFFIRKKIFHQFKLAYHVICYEKDDETALNELKEAPRILEKLVNKVKSDVNLDRVDERLKGERYALVPSDLNKTFMYSKISAPIFVKNSIPLDLFEQLDLLGVKIIKQENFHKLNLDDIKFKQEKQLIKLSNEQKLIVEDIKSNRKEYLKIWDLFKNFKEKNSKGSDVIDRLNKLENSVDKTSAFIVEVEAVLKFLYWILNHLDLLEEFGISFEMLIPLPFGILKLYVLDLNANTPFGYNALKKYIATLISRFKKSKALEYRESYSIKKILKIFSRYCVKFKLFRNLLLGNHMLELTKYEDSFKKPTRNLLKYLAFAIISTMRFETLRRWCLSDIISLTMEKVRMKNNDDNFLIENIFNNLNSELNRVETCLTRDYENDLKMEEENVIKIHGLGVKSIYLNKLSWIKRVFSYLLSKKIFGENKKVLIQDVLSYLSKCNVVVPERRTAMKTLRKGKQFNDLSMCEQNEWCKLKKLVQGSGRFCKSYVFLEKTFEDEKTKDVVDCINYKGLNKFRHMKVFGHDGKKVTQTIKEVILEFKKSSKEKKISDDYISKYLRYFLMDNGDLFQKTLCEMLEDKRLELSVPTERRNELFFKDGKGKMLNYDAMRAIYNKLMLKRSYLRKIGNSFGQSRKVGINTLTIPHLFNKQKVLVQNSDSKGVHCKKILAEVQNKLAVEQVHHEKNSDDGTPPEMMKNHYTYANLQLIDLVRSWDERIRKLKKFLPSKFIDEEKFLKCCEKGDIVEVLEFIVVNCYFDKTCWVKYNNYIPRLLKIGILLELRRRDLEEDVTKFNEIRNYLYVLISRNIHLFPFILREISKSVYGRFQFALTLCDLTKNEKKRFRNWIYSLILIKEIEERATIDCFKFKIKTEDDLIVHLLESMNFNKILEELDFEGYLGNFLKKRDVGYFKGIDFGEKESDRGINSRKVEMKDKSEVQFVRDVLNDLLNNDDDEEEDNLILEEEIEDDSDVDSDFVDSDDEMDV